MHHKLVSGFPESLCYSNIAIVFDGSPDHTAIIEFGQSLAGTFCPNFVSGPGEGK